MGYNCGIMLRRIAILAIATFMAVCVSGQPDKTPDQNQQPAKQGQPAVVTANSPNERSNGQTHQPQGSPDSPKWYAALERPDWWVVGLAFLTACVICWQSWETRKAARGAERAADATLAQTQLMRDKERARLIVEPNGLEVVNDPESKPGWYLKATIKVQNIGASRAFSTKGMASLWVQDSSAPITHPEFRFPWNSPRAFDISIEPGDYVVDLESRFPVDPESPELTVNQLLEGLFSSGDADSSIPPKKAVYLQGSVEYETLGVIFHRNYGWYWTPMDADMGGTLMGGTSIEGRWFEGRDQKNGEHSNPN